MGRGSAPTVRAESTLLNFGPHDVQMLARIWSEGSDGVEAENGVLKADGLLGPHCGPISNRRQTHLAHDPALFKPGPASIRTRGGVECPRRCFEPGVCELGFSALRA